jgi:DNA-binding HxlR family transcriptional regulator
MSMFSASFPGGTWPLGGDGLVTRTVVPTVPVTVSYELTDLGLSLHQMMRDLKTWADMHMDDVLANRVTYDAR